MGLRKLLSWVGRFALFAALYLILTDHPVTEEFVAAFAIAAALATLATVGEQRFRLHYGDLRRLLPSAARIPRDCAIVAAEIVAALLRGRRLTGAFEIVPFRYGERDDPDEAARRALVTYGICLAPNGYAVAVQGGDILVHHLRPEKTGVDDRDWPL